MPLCSPCPLFHHFNRLSIEKSLFTLLTHAYKLRNWHNVPWIFNNYLSPAQKRFVPAQCIVGRAELNINRPRCPAGSRNPSCQTGGKKFKSCTQSMRIFQKFKSVQSLYIYIYKNKENHYHQRTCAEISSITSRIFNKFHSRGSWWHTELFFCPVLLK